ncbi:hypothetical protein [Adhaeribacter rhizoryzae]|uniref:Uncharacterized protein n=1 Tax=Adhaeribacter rhizoryzae TaxID=2607907 RepID=A0A5M6DBN1_9BACT|nr:hypothetical protein [Adhaeribacter rhizoryzae]KAA5544954.1 hypothetical protein F0145_12910 [Adhaeribacter rhizoryzae]
MRGTDMKEMEVGYLYYSLYSYRRKIEADIKKVIRAKNEYAAGQAADLQDSSEKLYKLTHKLRNISLIISKLISLNKVYK